MIDPVTAAAGILIAYGCAWLTSAPKRRPLKINLEALKDGAGWERGPATKIGPGAAQGNVGLEYNPDKELESFREGVVNPVYDFMERVKKGEAIVEQAWILEARIDENGQMMPDRLLESESGVSQKPYRVRKVNHAQFVEAITKGEADWKALPSKALEAREAKKYALEKAWQTIRESRAEAQKIAEAEGKKLREDFIDTGGLIDGITTRYDRSQFTEYTPIMGGPFNRQLYMFDHLRAIAVSFESLNHNPVSRRIADIYRDYTGASEFKIACKDTGYLEQVNGVIEAIQLRAKLPFWDVEFTTYGALLIDNIKWQTIDPSTVWQIVHEPDNVNAPLYYYQSYPTDYQQFTGLKVPGVPNSEKAASMKYIVRQLPFDQVIHIKDNCMSNEVRGRSIFFPLLGVLKRIKDYLDARVIRAQLQACFVFDDTIDGSDADVLAHASQYSGMPVAGSVFAHNKQVERKPMPALSSATSGADSTYDDLLGQVSTRTGIAKEALNVVAKGAGSRATALVGSEPFTKVIDRRQGVFKNLVHTILSIEMPRRGLVYDKNKIEVIFPSVTKDTTTETVKNITIGEAQGYIDKRTAGQMYAAEMRITSYDFEAMQNQMAKDKAAGLDQVGDMPPPPGRAGMGDNPEDGDEGSPIQGDGAAELKDQLGTI